MNNENITVSEEISAEQQFFNEFNNGLHKLGKISLIAAIIILVAVPFIYGIVNGVSVDVGGFFSGIY